MGGKPKFFTPFASTRAKRGHALVDDNDAAIGEREAFYKTLKDGGKIRAGGGLDCGLVEEDWMDCFEANEIWVVQCEGPVNEWTILRKLHVTLE